MLTTSNNFKTAINATTRQFKSQVKIFFDPENPVTLAGDRLLKWSLLEETKSDLGTLGRVSANTIKLTLANQDRIFSPANNAGPYYGQLLPNVKLQLEIGLLVSGAYEWLPLGTFWSSDWSAPEGSIEASIDGYDLMYSIGQQETPLIKVAWNTTIASLVEALLQKLGLASSEYGIDQTLSQPVKVGWIGDGKVSDALQRLAEAGNACVYLTRDNILKVHNLARVPEPVAVMTEHNQLLDVQLPQRYKDVYSQVGISIYGPVLEGSEEIASMPLAMPGHSQTQINRQRFSKAPIGALYYVSCEDDMLLTHANIRNMAYSSHAFDACIVNPNTGGQEVNLKMVGCGIDTTKNQIMLENPGLKAVIGDKMITIDNELIQDQQTGITYASNLLQRVSDGHPLASVKCRGNPAIELNDVVTVQWGAYSLDMKIHRIQTDFDGGLMSTVEGLKTSVLAANDWAAISPGLYIYAANEMEG